MKTAYGKSASGLIKLAYIERIHLDGSFAVRCPVGDPCALTTGFLVASGDRSISLRTVRHGTKEIEADEKTIQRLRQLQSVASRMMKPDYFVDHSGYFAPIDFMKMANWHSFNHIIGDGKIYPASGFFACSPVGTESIYLFF